MFFTPDFDFYKEVLGVLCEILNGFICKQSLTFIIHSPHISTRTCGLTAGREKSLQYKQHDDEDVPRLVLPLHDLLIGAHVRKD